MSSDVGGIRSNWNNELIHNENGYVYPADAPYMLAYYIMNLFNNDELAQKFSHNARPKAIKFYDKNGYSRVSKDDISTADNEFFNEDLDMYYWYKYEY